MTLGYAYSFDREAFTGCFESREKAFAHALEKCRREELSVPTVYIGQIMPPDPHAGGNAEDVLDNMRRRCRIDIGEAADAWLTNLTAAQIRELDADLEATLLNWLTRHGLMPTESRTCSISEHSIPASPTTSSDSGTEVHDIGPISLYQE